jgi:hypothetical protein
MLKSPITAWNISTPTFPHPIILLVVMNLAINKMKNKIYHSFIMAKTSYIRRDDNDVCFPLDQHA